MIISNAHAIGLALMLVAATPAADFTENSVPVALDVQRHDPARMQAITKTTLSGEFERYRQIAARDGFFETEQKMLAAAADPAFDEFDHHGVALATFYAAHGMNAEAISIARAIESWRSHHRLSMIVGRGLFELGRWGDVADVFAFPVFSGDQSARAFRGMAHAKLGAFQLASVDLLEREIMSAPTGFDIELAFARAMTAAHLGAYQTSRQALASLRHRPLSDVDRARRNFLEAKLMIAEGRTGPGLSLLQELSIRAQVPLSIAARVAALEYEVENDLIAIENAEVEVDAIALQWRGGEVERAIIALQTTLADKADNIGEAMDIRRSLIQKFPTSDIAEDARIQLRDDLTNLFERQTVSPLTAARIFYENIDLAPPGRTGDELIRSVSQELIALDLTDAAAELLHHQTFHRLRGEARSILAAQLAELYLENARPSDSLDVLQRTRRTGLPEDVEMRRRLAKARALFETGKIDDALYEIEDDQSAPAHFLRGDILLKSENYPDAAAAYTSAFAALPAGRISPVQTSRFFTSIATYLRQGDLAGAKKFASSHRDRLADDSAQALLDELIDAGFERGSGDLLAVLSAHFEG